jgi:hypothetical protein
MRLRQRALHLQTHVNRAAGVRRALPELARRVVDGLLQAWHPQCLVGLAAPGDTTYRSFLHLQDIQAVDAVLHILEHDPAYRLQCRAA